MDWVPPLMDELGLFMSEHLEPVLRLLLAAALGGIIGLEREASGKPAGFRTNLLICVGAALLTELSLQVAHDALLPGGLRSDPGRIAAQIVSGIGFLGAGTILRSHGNVTGLTTAATLWVVAAIGMAAGAGAYVQALVGTALVMLALMILGRFEDHLVPRPASDRVVRVSADAAPEMVGGVEQILSAAGFHVTTVDVEKSDEGWIASFSTSAEGVDVHSTVERLLREPAIRRVTVL